LHKKTYSSTSTLQKTYSLAYSDSSRGERGRRKRKDAGEVTCKTTGSRRGHARPHELRGQGHRGGGVGRRPGHRGAAACSGERKDAGGVRWLEAACSGGSRQLDSGRSRRRCACVCLERGERLRLGFGDGAWKKKA
jgi:hypothetical protein